MPGTYWSARRIFNRLVARFNLHTVPQQPEDVAINQQIQPVTNIDELLCTQKMIVFPGVSAPATNTIVLFTVPAGKRWRVKRIHAVVSSGSLTMTNIAIEDENNVGMIINIPAASNDIYYGDVQAQQFTMEPGWKLYIYAVVSVSGTIDTTVYLQEEDAY